MKQETTTPEAPRVDLLLQIEEHRLTVIREHQARDEALCRYFRDLIKGWDVLN
jgi:hypothetical protein